MENEKTAAGSGVNRAKTYQLVLFPLNNGATNVYYVLIWKQCIRNCNCICLRNGHGNARI